MATTRKSSAKKAVEKPIVSRRSTRYKEPVTPTKPNQSAATEGKVSSSSPKKAITKKRTSKKTAAKKKNANEVVYLEEGDVVPVLQKPVFETFTADIMLNEGLSIIRDIGGGKYEIMNLSAVDFTKLGSEEVGLQIKTNPGRFSMVTGLDVEKWDSAREKCLHAARSANLEIFRLEKLPLELRRKVYEFALVCPKHLQHGFRTSSGVALLRTSRRMYEEASEFFYKNTFNLTDHTKINKDDWASTSRNIKSVSFDWWGWSIKDPQTLRSIAMLPNLKVMTIVLTQYSTGGQNLLHKRQTKYQDNQSIAKFNKTNGFDALVEIRGLDVVKVRNKGPDDHGPPAIATDAEITAFETFLNSVLTKPPFGMSTRRTKRLSFDDE